MFAPGRGGRRFHHDDIDLKLNQLDSENGKSIQLFRSPSVRNANVLPFYIAQLPQGGFENFVKSSWPGSAREISNAVNFFLLLCLGYRSTSSTATTRIDKTAAFFIAHRVREDIYHVRGSCEKCYLEQKGTPDSSRGERLI